MHASALAEFRTYHRDATEGTVLADFPFDDWLIANIDNYFAKHPGVTLTDEHFRVWMACEYAPLPCKPDMSPHTGAHGPLLTRTSH